VDANHWPDECAPPQGVEERAEMITTWRVLISEAMEARGESWTDVEAMSLLESQLDAEFNAGFGMREGLPFTVWTKKSVYFPIVYDGREWAGSVSRHPGNKMPTNHQGGE